VCPSFLAGAAGTAPFSVSLNGVDFIADATAQMQYKFYEQPDYHVGLDPLTLTLTLTLTPTLTLTLTLTLNLTLTLTLTRSASSRPEGRGRGARR
jgi:hypothetical protein